VTITLLVPLAFFMVAKNTGIDSMQMKASVLDSAMPLGLTAYAISLEYKLEVPLVSRIVVVSTVLAIVVIPLWITFLG
ncbi:MAG TPA: AEC family transporter, partial [Draconibacterium sp.]|nr:AEC family transporter [Draconibacterium sp.]